jgi:predicted ATPase
MNQIQNIKFTLDEIKGLELNNLGKINILCGKNNSGKSTLLRNIHTTNNCEFGVKLNIDVIQKLTFPIREYLETIVEEYDDDEGYNYRTNDIYTEGYDEDDAPFLKQAKDIFEELAKEKPDKIFWGKFILINQIELMAVKKGYLKYNDVNKIVPLDDEKLMNQFDNWHIEQVAKQLFNNEFIPIYIPAKRNPSVCINVIPNDKQDERFMRLLFELKNSFHSENKKSKYNKLQNAFFKITDGYNFDLNLDYFYKLSDTSLKNLETIGIVPETINKLKKIKDEEYFYQDITNKISKIVTSQELQKVITTLEKEQKIILYFSKDKEKYFSAIDTGIGYRDLLYILACVTILDNKVLLIEEPENHISPDIQRKLLKYLKDDTDKQYFIATHSNIFLDDSYVNTIFHIQYNDKISVENQTEKANLLKDLGYLAVDNLYVDVLILTEGYTDVDALEMFIETLRFCIGVNVKFLYADSITKMPKIRLSAVKDNYHTVIVLVDGDNNEISEDARKELEQECTELGIKYKKLCGYGIESYFTVEALKKKYNNPPNRIIITNIDKTKDLGEQLSKQVSAKTLKKDIRDIAKYMTEKEIKETGDLYQFLEELDTICKEIHKLLCNI